LTKADSGQSAVEQLFSSLLTFDAAAASSR